MDYGGNDRRKSKKDLKRKRLARGYKRGGRFRTQNVEEVSVEKEIKIEEKKEKKGKFK
jgi:hypothetical protein